MPYELVNLELASGQGRFQARVSLAHSGNTENVQCSNPNPVLAALRAVLHAVIRFRSMPTVEFEIDGGENQAKAVIAKVYGSSWVLCHYPVEPPPSDVPEKAARAFIHAINHMNQPQQVAT